MYNLLNTIKELAQKGYEKSVISNDADNKELFLNIMLKTEIVLNNVENKNKVKIQFNEKKTNRTYEKIEDNTKREMYLIAYCFSYYEHTCLYPQYNQDKAFNVAAEKLGVKKSTLKNARDWFDGHNNNARSGWWQAPLPEDMEKFKKIYSKKSEADTVSEAKNILGIN